MAYENWGLNFSEIAEAENRPYVKATVNLYQKFTENKKKGRKEVRCIKILLEMFCLPLPFQLHSTSLSNKGPSTFILFSKTGYGKAYYTN